MATKDELKNNCYHLASAIGTGEPLAPTARVVRDGHHEGTLFAWDGGAWVAIDLENGEYLGRFDRLAVVTLEGDADPDDGLNQVALAIDFEAAEWVVDPDTIDDLEESYGDSLALLWTQS